MNIILWISQALLAIMFLAAGLIHAFRYEWASRQPKTAWVTDLPRGLLTCIGLYELLDRQG